MARKGRPDNLNYGPARPLTEGERDMVTANMGLAHKEAWRIACVLAGVHSPVKSAELREQFRDELVDAAYVALCLSVQRYNPNLGFTFGTFAFHQIRGAVGRASRKASIRLGMDASYKRGVHVRMLSEEHGPRAGDDDYDSVPVLDQRGQDDYDPWLTPEFLCLMSLFLLKRDYRWVSLNVLEGVTMQEIAKAEGVSRQWVNQVIQRALKKLRKSKGFIEALVAQMARRKAAPTRTDFRGSGVATLIA